MKSLHLESFPVVALKVTPARPASVRSALVIACAVHALLGLALCRIIITQKQEKKSDPIFSLSIMDSSGLPNSDTSFLPFGTRIAPVLPLQTRPEFVVSEPPAIPEIERVQVPPSLDPSDFGDSAPLALQPPSPSAAPRNLSAPRSFSPETAGRADPPASTTRSAIGRAASLRSAPQPGYPTLAVRQSRAGTAHIRLAISAEGRVTDSDLARSSGHDDLDAAALKATARWKFRPALSADGTPIASRVVVPVVFTLR